MLRRLKARLRKRILARDEEIRRLEDEVAALADIAGQHAFVVGFCIVLLEGRGVTTFSLDELSRLCATKTLCWYQKNGVFVLETFKINEKTLN